LFFDLLPFYAILRSIPNKLLGVIAMFAAILTLLLLPFTDVSRSRGMQFKPLSKLAFFAFIANFLILMQLGAKHVESPFIEFGQISTILYFVYFTFLIYSITLVGNSFIELNFYSRNHSIFHSLSLNYMNIQKSSIIPNCELMPITIFVGLDMVTDKERLIPVI
jgi:hypothetical protein